MSPVSELSNFEISKSDTSICPSITSFNAGMPGTPLMKKLDFKDNFSREGVSLRKSPSDAKEM
jgi:hypothetical protein